MFSQRERCSAFSPTSSRLKCLFVSFFPSLPSLQGTSLFAAHAFSFFLLLLLLLAFSCFSPHAPPKKMEKKTATAIVYTTALRRVHNPAGNAPRLSSHNEVRAGCICQGAGRRGVTRVAESFLQHSPPSTLSSALPTLLMPGFSVPQCDFFFLFHLSAWSSDAGFFFFFGYLLIPTAVVMAVIIW